MGVSVLAMGADNLWHLRQGFGAYLQARGVERLNDFVQVVEGRLTHAGSTGDLVDGRMGIAEVQGGRLPALASPLGGLQVRPDLPLVARGPAA